jgi:hypothetical protein
VACEPSILRKEEEPLRFDIESPDDRQSREMGAVQSSRGTFDLGLSGNQ